MTNLTVTQEIHEIILRELLECLPDMDYDPFSKHHLNILLGLYDNKRLIKLAMDLRYIERWDGRSKYKYVLTEEAKDIFRPFLEL